MLKPIKKWLEANSLYFAIGLALIIAVLSLISIKDLNPVKIRNSDKFGHLIAYACLGIAWFYYGFKHNKKIGYIFILLVVYGIILEALQGALTSYREPDFYDILANTIGVFVGWIIMTSLFRKSQYF